MQNSLPEASIGFEQETAETPAASGLDRSGDAGLRDADAGRPQRFIERGVRFIQVQHTAPGGGEAWDAHGGLKANHERNFRRSTCRSPRTAQGPRQQGPARLDAGPLRRSEFGRTPGRRVPTAATTTSSASRVWMAGGRIKGGLVHGVTDEIGFHAVENRHYVTDVHATISASSASTPDSSRSRAGSGSTSTTASRSRRSSA